MVKCIDLWTPASDLHGSSQNLFLIFQLLMRTEIIEKSGKAVVFFCSLNLFGCKFIYSFAVKSLSRSCKKSEWLAQHK